MVSTTPSDYGPEGRIYLCEWDSTDTDTDIAYKDFRDDKDVKYPHFCFKCDKKLRFHEILEANKNLTVGSLNKLWKSKFVKFYCCICYGRRSG